MSQTSQSVSNQEKNSESTESTESTESVDWKIKRNEALSRARDKANLLRKQIRDAMPEDNTPKGKTKLSEKLKKLKSLPVNAQKIVAVDEKVSEVENTDDIVNNLQDVTADPTVVEKLIETPVETFVKPKKVRKATVKKEIFVVKEPKEPEEPEETLKEPMKVEEPPTKIEKIEVPPPKPTFQRGLDGVWYF